MTDTDTSRRQDALSATDERATMTPERVAPAIETYVETRADGTAALRLEEAEGTAGAWISAAAPRENEQ